MVGANILSRFGLRTGPPANPALLQGAIDTISSRVHPGNPSKWLLYGLSGGQEVASGVHINEATAQTVTAVFGCQRIISETLATIPLNVYRRLPNGGKEIAPEHPLFKILHTQPNPMTSAVSHREASTAHVALWGNSYSEIERDGAGNVSALWLLSPNRVEPFRSQNRMWYRISLPKGGTTVLDDSRILHVPGLGFDGLVGYSIVAMAREAIGLAKAAETFGAGFYGKGAKPSGILTHPTVVGPKGKQNLKKSLEQKITGLDNSNRLLLLEEGMKWQQVSLSQEDSQFLQTRTFQVAEIARMFRMPLHKLQELTRATFSNIEHQSIEYVTDVIVPWAVRHEQAYLIRLFTPTDRQRGFFAEHVIAGLLRGDIKSRYEAYNVGRQNGWLNANDIRSLENLNPIPAADGGNVYIVPLNMQTMSGLVGPGGEPLPPEPEPEFESLRCGCGRSHKATNPRHVENRSLQAQLGLDAPFFRLLRRAFQKIVAHETDAIRKAVTRIWDLRQDPFNEFRAWVEKFYQDFDEFVIINSAPVIRAYAEATTAIVGPSVVAPETLSPTLEKFVSDYTAGFANRYSGFSVAQLKMLMDQAPAGDIAELLIQRSNEWAVNRANKLAADEVVRQSNAVALEVYREAGVVRLVWTTIGKNCPFCNELDGKTVGIGGAFFMDGETLTAKDENDNYQTIKMRGPKFHPPIHRGCDCRILPHA